MIHKKAVEKALREAGVRYQTSGSSPLVQLWCPWHNDKQTPSLVIYTNSTPVSGHCFGCGVHPTWEDIQHQLKVGELSSQWDDPEFLKHLKQIAYNLNRTPFLPRDSKPWFGGKWRGLPPSFLQKINSRQWFDEVDKTARILWPVWDVVGDLVGWVSRRLDKNTQVRKYRNAPAMKALTTLWPWPTRWIGEVPTIVLVEGPYDALRLLYRGIPALALLGTNWSYERTALLLGMGVERVILALDADPAGFTGANKIAAKLQNMYTGNNLALWNWPDKKDAGNAPLTEVWSLRKEIDPKAKHMKPHKWIDHLPELSPGWFYNFEETRVATRTKKRLLEV
jgi:DNA primase